MPEGKPSVVSSCYRCLVFNSVGALTNMTDMLHGSNMAAPEFQTMDSTLEKGVLMNKEFLLCVMYCWPFISQLQPIL